jgi:hypothetical protein
MIRYLAILLEEAAFEESRYPGPNRDKLFQPAIAINITSLKGTPDAQIATKESICENPLRSSCSVLGCDETMLIYRARLVKAKEALESPKPVIHHGRIAYGHTVMRSDEDHENADTECRDYSIRFK